MNITTSLHSWITSFEETIGGGDVNNLLCHDQEGLEETRQLRSLGESFSSFYRYVKITFSAISLKNCPEKVKRACHFSYRKAKSNCGALLDQAKSELQRCLDIPSFRSCPCWENKVLFHNDNKSFFSHYVFRNTSKKSLKNVRWQIFQNRFQRSLENAGQYLGNIQTYDLIFMNANNVLNLASARSLKTKAFLSLHFVASQKINYLNQQKS